MKKLVMILTLLSLLLVVGCLGGAYFYLTGPVGGNHTVKMEVKEGDTFSSIAKTLKEKKLIRNEVGYKILLKMKKPASLASGIYDLNSSMSASKIIDVLKTSPKQKSVQITFKEGRNMRYIVNRITEKTALKAEDIYQKLKDVNYLKALKQKYWFITDDVQNTSLYYALEGYLYPDTYSFVSNATVEDIFEKMLDNMNQKLTPYKAEITKSGYTVHQIITMASMVELEANSLEDRKGVAGVFYNRLKVKMSLGSDVTTYYGAKIDMGERDLYKAELTANNPYNTRNTSMLGKLPVGPVCNPDIDSIVASLEPTIGAYYYFVADRNGKVYFTKTNTEHNQIIAKLKKDGLWYTY